MRRHQTSFFFLLLVTAFVFPAESILAEAEAETFESEASAIRDGRIHDPGLAMEQPAEKAPEELAKLVPWLGTWKVEMTVQRPGQEEVLRSEGVGQLSLMNRGHAVMERTRFEDFDAEGHSMATLAFLAVNGSGTWTAGEGSSWTRAIDLASGGFDGEALVLHDAARPRGGATLLYSRRTYAPIESGGYEMRLDVSSDRGESWNRVVTRRTVERLEGDLPVRQDVGLPAPDRPEEAAQFDFLLGEFDATHWLKRPQGEVRWKSDATAVYALDGHAVLEFDSFDTDPNLPDAATSILRIWNDGMRRWESLFLTNRSNSNLHFGGVREGENIVLRPFDTQVGSGPLSQWIFFAIEDDAYRWKGIRSTDRGETWEPRWTIDFERKGKAEVAASQE